MITAVSEIRYHQAEHQLLLHSLAVLEHLAYKLSHSLEVLPLFGPQNSNLLNLCKDLRQERPERNRELHAGLALNQS